MTLVFDTTAFINGWWDHYRPTTFPGVWVLIGAAITDGRVVVPREVYRELRAQEDELSAWMLAFSALVVAPSEEVQADAGRIQGMFPQPGIRNGADPFVVAESRARGCPVVTYEGRSFSGTPHKRWWRTMPGICSHLEVECRTLPEAIALLDGHFP